MCCSAVRCGEVRCGAVRCSAWQYVAVRCKALQCVAARCSCGVLQRVAVLPFFSPDSPYTLQQSSGETGKYKLRGGRGRKNGEGARRIQSKEPYI